MKAAGKDQQNHQIPDRMIDHSRSSLGATGLHARILTASGRQSNQIYPTQTGGVGREIRNYTGIIVRYWHIADIANQADFGATLNRNYGLG